MTAKFTVKEVKTPLSVKYINTKL